MNRSFFLLESVSEPCGTYHEIVCNPHGPNGIKVSLSFPVVPILRDDPDACDQKYQQND